MTDSVLVSICIPTFNGEKYIAEAVESALAQTYTPIEIVVSDGGSQDATLRIAEACCNAHSEASPAKIFRILDDGPPGMVPNWNYAISQARGEFIKFLFQDDVLYPNCVERLVNAANVSQRVGLAFSRRDVRLQDDFRNDEAARTIAGWCAAIHDYWPHPKLGVQRGRDILGHDNLLDLPLNKIGEPSNVLVRREAFSRVGNFDGTLRQLVDSDMWLRILTQYDVAFVDEALSTFRVHPDQATMRNWNSGQSRNDDLRFIQRIASGPIYKNLSWKARRRVYQTLASIPGSALPADAPLHRWYETTRSIYHTARRALRRLISRPG